MISIKVIIAKAPMNFLMFKKSNSSHKNTVRIKVLQVTLISKLEQYLLTLQDQANLTSH